MFRFLNKIMKKNVARVINSSGGQVAIVLILVIAAALIFYAVSLNLGKFTLSKALVTIASNTSASMLGSSMASYGQALSETSLGGRRKICGWTGILAAIIAIVIIVIAIIISIYSPGAGGAAWLAGQGLALALVGLSLAVIALVLQVVVIQPGISEAWNRIMSKTLSLSNQFTESAIQSALGKAVTDLVEVPDVDDIDGDLIWVPVSAINTPPFADTVNRYAAYYDERLRQIKDQVALAEVADFILALEEFLYEGADGWGIYDPMPPELCIGMAECYPCCVPNAAIVGGEALTNIRSQTCPSFDDDDVWFERCENTSPYQIPPPGAPEGYPFIFGWYLDNPFNEFFSFRELVGRDDLHQDFYKDPLDPNSDPESLPGPARPSQLRHAVGGSTPGFRLEDTTGFYVPPVYPAGIEDRKGIFPFFYKVADWGVGLEEVADSIAAGTMTGQSRECHWCDARDPTCPPCSGLPPHPHPPEIPQLVLPLDPADSTSRLAYNLSYMVDGPGNAWDAANAFPRPYPPLAVDKVTIEVPREIIAAEDICAQDSLYPLPSVGNGFWRRGMDLFCRMVAPYHMECPKCAGDPDCNCTPSTASDFPDDALDDIVLGLADFIEWAQFLLDQASDLATFVDDLPNWYEEVAVWIEPISPPATQASDPPCFLCSLVLPDGTPVPEGLLWIFLKELTEIRDRIIGWINFYNPITGNYEGYRGANCTEVWCVPSSLACPQVSVGEGEDATFDTNLNGIRGDVEDIVGCLNYNVNGYDHVAGEAFKACLAGCSPANCRVGNSLPAYHIDGVTPYEYPATALNCSGWSAGNSWYDAIRRNVALAVNPPTILEGNDYRFQRCAHTCGLEACHRLPRSMVPFTRDAIYWPANYQPVDPATANGNWIDLTAFSDCLNHCNPETCRVGPRLPRVHSANGVTPYAYPGGPLDCTTNWGIFMGGNPWYDQIMTHKLGLMNPDESDLAPMLLCFDDCNENVPDCQNMPDIQTTTGDPYLWTAPPVGFDPVVDCDPVTNQPNEPWYSEIAANAIIAGGPSCDLTNNPDPAIADGWLYSTRQSAIEARNQVVKFEKRRDFFKRPYDLNGDGIVDSWKGRLHEAQNILFVLDGEDTNRNGLLDVGEDFNGDGFLDTGIIPELEEFLRGPAADLIRARISYDPNPWDSGLPYEAVYGWRDEDVTLEDGTTQRGKWHIVKVEARIPSVCDDRCSSSPDPSASQTSPDPRWPRIWTYTKNWGTERCYELVNTDGSVKFRTTRYDEDKTGNWMTFPNRERIWQFRSNHPERPVDRGVYNPDMLDGACAGSTLMEIPRTNIPTTAYMGAFIMNRFYGPGDPNDNHRCWNLAHGLLSTGVVNETCARYYWHGGINEGMGLEFVRCEEF